jgi:hypothetical protein
MAVCIDLRDRGLFPFKGTSWGYLLNERDVVEKLRKDFGGCKKGM